MKKKRILTIAGIAAFFVAVITVIIVLLNVGRTSDDSSETGIAVGDTTTGGYVHITTDATTSDRFKETMTTENGRTSPSEIGDITSDDDNFDTVPKPITTTAGADKTTSRPDNNTTDNTTESTTATESEQPTAAESSVESNITQFSFVKYDIAGMPDTYNWSEYLLRKGYKNVNNRTELTDYAQSVLNKITETKGVRYILAPRGIFDDIIGENPSDAHLYELFGMDYQTYMCKGVAIFRMRKVQDVVNRVTDKSVYAIYYYSYEDYVMMTEVDNKIKEIVAGFSGSEFDKIKAAHDYLCANVEYKEVSDGYASHTSYGALINGQSVCEGYAKAYKLMLNAMDIPCDMVVNATHGWNEVFYENKWYMVDVTNDDTSSSYCYFMLGSDVMLSRTDKYVESELIDEEKLGRISYYNYVDGTNSSVNKLAEFTYNSIQRVTDKIPQ